MNRKEFLSRVFTHKVVIVSLLVTAVLCCLYAATGWITINWLRIAARILLGVLIFWQVLTIGNVGAEVTKELTPKPKTEPKKKKRKNN